MRYHAIAADYDGTLAENGGIRDDTWAALRRARASGRKLVMVTGRQLEDLLTLLPHPDLFDRIVAENGAVLYQPSTREARGLVPPPPPHFVTELRKRGVANVACGRVIVATTDPYEDIVHHTIHELGLELQMIFNKGAVMVLPTGCNKATGLVAALAELGLSPHNVVAVGDAENDHALLDGCECGVAVGNALQPLKDRADLVTAGRDGAGVGELIGHLLSDDLGTLELRRHHILLGRSDQTEIAMDPYASTVLVCGTSGGGKSTVTTSVLERMCRAGYQFAIIDPEGDYGSLAFAVKLGAPQQPPHVGEVIEVLRDPTRNVVVNLLGVPIDQRPERCTELLHALSELRSRTGRPHWIVIDEAHHVLPATWAPAAEQPYERGRIYVTVHPASVAPSVLYTIDTLLAVGERPDRSLAELCAAAGVPMPELATIDRLPPGQALHWRVGEPKALVIQTELPKSERTRHSRKYIEGNLGKHRSFYFRGPDGRLNLKAHNLQLFLDLGDGVDDDTWMHHLRLREYSRWIRTEVKDVELADEVAAIELGALGPTDSRAAIRAAVDRRYTLPVQASDAAVQ